MKFDFNINNIDAVVYDFDGVMTDNKVLTFSDGLEAVVVNRSDGLGIRALKNAGIKQQIISAETNIVVTVRAKKLGIPVLQNCINKLSALKTLCKANSYDLNKVVYVGNDLNDFEVMKAVGFPIAPFDAHEEIKEIAILTTKSVGGSGVIREVAENILGIENFINQIKEE